MYTAVIDPMKYHEAKYQQLLREAQQYRLAQEALKARPPKDWFFSDILAVLGGKLKDLGAGLEKRYGTSPPAMVQLKKQSNSECC